MVCGAARAARRQALGERLAGGRVAEPAAAAPKARGLGKLVAKLKGPAKCERCEELRAEPPPDGWAALAGGAVQVPEPWSWFPGKIHFSSYAKDREALAGQAHADERTEPLIRELDRVCAAWSERLAERGARVDSPSRFGMTRFEIQLRPAPFAAAAAAVVPSAPPASALDQPSGSWGDKV